MSVSVNEYLSESAGSTSTVLVLLPACVASENTIFISLEPMVRRTMAGLPSANSGL